MTMRVTSKTISQKFPLADLSSLPTSDPGGGKPWRSPGATGHQIVVGAFTSPSGGVTDHGALTGLADDDHPQYVLANGSRAMTGNLTVTNGSDPQINLQNGAANLRIRLNEAGAYAYSEIVSTGTLALRADGGQVIVFGYSYFDLRYGASYALRTWNSGKTELAGIVGWDDILLVNGPSFQSGLLANFQKGGTTVASVAANGTITTTSLLKVGTLTVATLPSASANPGARAEVTDSSVTTFRSIVAGGGSNRVDVKSNGTNWLVN